MTVLEEWLRETYPRAMSGFKDYAREAFISGYLESRRKIIGEQESGD
jgi:hypothetical protein